MPGLHSHAAYLYREAAISAAINAVLIAAFFGLVFGMHDAVEIWGSGGYVFDFAPQGFAIGLMAVLVPGLLCRRAIMRGSLVATDPAIGRLVRQAIATALIAGGSGSAIAAAFLWVAGWATIGTSAAFAVKVIYGAILGGGITFGLLRKLFRLN